jgi:hypothetical protein
VKNKIRQAKIAPIPPDEDTPGAVHEPSPSGRTVSGGWLKKAAGK